VHFVLRDRQWELTGWIAEPLLFCIILYFSTHLLCLLLASSCFMLISRLAYSLKPKMEAVCSSKTFVHLHWTAWYYTPEDRTLNILCFGDSSSLSSGVDMMSDMTVYCIAFLTTKYAVGCPSADLLGNAWQMCFILWFISRISAWKQVYYTIKNNYWILLYVKCMFIFFHSYSHIFLEVVYVNWVIDLI
jgi:hypothetical protein